MDAAHCFVYSSDHIQFLHFRTNDGFNTCCVTPSLAAALATPQPETTVTFPPTRTSRPAEVLLRMTNDITYTQNLWVDYQRSALDIYAPAELGEWPVIIFAHGYTGTKEDFIRKRK